MDRNDLIRQLEAYVPFNEQEEKDRDLILHELRKNPDVYGRESLTCHLSASAWTVNHSHDKALMAWHNIYRSWSWLGGHADHEEDLLSVAIREVQEEAGIQNVTPVTDNIFSVEVLTVDGHVKRGAYVPSHLHLNITYLLEADEDEQLHIKEDENSGVRWFSLEDAVASSSEEWMRENIYIKLMKKLQKIDEKCK